MTRAEVAKLLTLVSTFDSRTVGIDTVEAWFTILGDVDAEQAATVVRNHFATSTSYLMPAHIISGVSRLSGPRLLGSDRRMYCIHNYPHRECPKCEES